MFHLVCYYCHYFLSLADNIANDKTSGAYHWFRSGPEKRDPRSRIRRRRRPGDRVNDVALLVESILPRDALPAETASYARKRSGTTACLASIRSSRFVHRVFLYRDLPPGPHRNRNTPREQLPEDPGDTHLPAARSAVSSPCALIFFFIFDRV